MKTAFALLMGLLVLAGSSAQAADANRVRNLGFSKDGIYYAFIESVVQDGSGYPAARGFVVEVGKNKLVKYERVVIQDDSKPEKAAIDEVIKKLGLSNYRIDGKNLGNTLWVRLPTDLSAADLALRFSTNYWVDGGASTLSPKYQLQVSEVEEPMKESCFGMPSALLSVELAKTNGEGTVSRTVLQKDTRLPKSRNCAHSYQPRQVIENNGAIVVIVRYSTIGFEGPDWEHIAVTASGVLSKE